MHCNQLMSLLAVSSCNMVKMHLLHICTWSALRQIGRVRVSLTFWQDIKRTDSSSGYLQTRQSVVCTPPLSCIPIHVTKWRGKCGSINTVLQLVRIMRFILMGLTFHWMHVTARQVNLYTFSWMPFQRMQFPSITTPCWEGRRGIPSHLHCRTGGNVRLYLLFKVTVCEHRPPFAHIASDQLMGPFFCPVLSSATENPNQQPRDAAGVRFSLACDKPEQETTVSSGQMQGKWPYVI